MAKNKLSPPPQDLIKQAVASKIARMKVEKIAQRLDARLRADDPRLGGYATSRIVASIALHALWTKPKLEQIDRDYPDRSLLG
jgi:hypothetical protein